MAIIDPNTGEPFESNGQRLPRVCVGVLAGGSTVNSAFAESLGGTLIGHGTLFWAEQVWVHGGIPDDGRNQIVQTALENDMDYVFFMDSDMIFPKGALAKLIKSQLEIAKNWPEHRETPTVVGGIYNTRSDHRLNVYDWDEKLNSFRVKPIAPMSGLVKSDFVATGCQLVDLGIFDGLKYPWFEYWHKEFGPEKKVSKWSEDAVFAKKCYDIDIPHFADTDVVCKHIHSCVIYPINETEYQLEKMSGQAYPGIMSVETNREKYVEQREKRTADDDKSAKKKVSENSVLDRNN